MHKYYQYISLCGIVLVQTSPAFCSDSDLLLLGLLDFKPEYCHEWIEKDLNSTGVNQLVSNMQ